MIYNKYRLRVFVGCPSEMKAITLENTTLAQQEKLT